MPPSSKKDKDVEPLGDRDYDAIGEFVMPNKQAVTRTPQRRWRVASEGQVILCGCARTRYIGGNNYAIRSRIGELKRIVGISRAMLFHGPIPG
jgi:hypothetical protein